MLSEIPKAKVTAAEWKFLTMESTGRKRLEALLRKSSAVFLDFDGVLAHSEPVFRSSWNAALEPWEHEISEEDYWKYWSSLGQGLEGEIERKDLKGIDRHAAADRQKRIYRDLVNSNRVPLFPLAVPLIELLCGSSSYSTCIASNTDSDLIRTILDFNDASVIPPIVGGGGLPKKPSPAIFLKASELTGAHPEKTVVFEDSWKGVRAAEKGGFNCVLVLNSCNRKLDIPCEHKTDGLKELYQILLNMEREGRK
ncbi:MAG: HAD-IA family hydrolase [Candidatus Aegiribacteria sp.]|nr:HAD-IA family hydrolase [Candidatus Aegiribacteria sp.]MBD3294546.1 HAD-IA family hydrolase [Candidatus Fermentibacteria bacterium]